MSVFVRKVVRTMPPGEADGIDVLTKIGGPSYIPGHANPLPSSARVPPFRPALWYCMPAGRGRRPARTAGAVRSASSRRRGQPGGAGWLPDFVGPLGPDPPFLEGRPGSGY